MPFTYTPITEADTDPEAPGTSSLWKRWWKNPIAMFEGAVGAPRLERAALQDAIINRVKIDTGVASQAYSFPGGGGSLIVTLNPYSFFPANTGSAGTLTLSGSAANQDAPRVTVSNGSAASGNIQWRYINA